MRPQAELGPCCSSGKLSICPEPRLCSLVLAGRCPDAQKGCSYLLILGSNLIPSLWFKAPREVVAVVERKDVFLSSLS